MVYNQVFDGSMRQNNSELGFPIRWLRYCLSVLPFVSTHSVPVHRNVALLDTSFFFSKSVITTLTTDCDGSEPEYEYYDLDVGGVHGDEEIEESSGEFSTCPALTC